MNHLTPKQIEFVTAQPMFFVATAPGEGRVNVSPKGMDTLRVLDERRVVWLSLSGSGNETAAHVIDNGRMTLMWMSIDEQPLILRAYGTARVIYPRHDEWAELAALFRRWAARDRSSIWPSTRSRRRAAAACRS